MARDYANKKTHVNSRRRKPTYNPYKIILLALMVVAGIYFLNQAGILQHFKQQILTALSIASPQTKHSRAVAKANPQPRFEFYTLLPKNNPHLSSSTNNPATPTTTTTISATTTIKANSTTPNTTTPQSKLPSVADAIPAKAKTTVQAAAKQTHHQYTLQVASFKTMGEADNLKAKLALLGFDVAIETFGHQGLVWFRVKVGPYQSSHQANVAQARLLQQKYHAIIQHVG